MTDTSQTSDDINTLDTKVLEVSNMVKSFGGLAAVSDVSFSIKKGEIMALIGPNGAGKTTLFNCINGVYEPEGGSIKFNDLELTGLPPHKIAAQGHSQDFSKSGALQQPDSHRQPDAGAPPYE